MTTDKPVGLQTGNSRVIILIFAAQKPLRRPIHY